MLCVCDMRINYLIIIMYFIYKRFKEIGWLKNLLLDVFKMLRCEWLSYKFFSKELNFYILLINLSIFFFKRILK